MDWFVFTEISPIDLSRGHEGVELVPSAWHGTPAEDPLGLSSPSYSKERRTQFLMECDNPELFKYLDWYWKNRGTFTVLARPSTEIHFPEGYFSHTSTPTPSGQTYDLLQGRDQRPRTDSPRHPQTYQKHHNLLSNYYSMTTASPRSSRSQVNIRHPRDRDPPSKKSYEQYPSNIAMLSDMKRRCQRSPVHTTSQQKSERWFSERKYVEQEALYGKRMEVSSTHNVDYEIRYADPEVRIATSPISFEMAWSPDTPGSVPFEPKMAVLNSFDHNSPRYKVFGKFHIVKVARFVSVLFIIGTIANLIFSLTRTSTIVYYGFILSAFAAGIYGSLVYGVFKEKRTMLIPFMVFQSVYIVVGGLIVISLIFVTAFSKDGLLQLGSDILGLSIVDSDDNISHVRGVAVIFIIIIAIYVGIEMWFFSIIYRFSHFLKDRETSFGFNMEPEFRLDPLSMD
ncbi:hypothetical protein FO519_006008 [Halicephalobus sp. NKZ332]|nr:hypothetical protein FO519_006008 [Halicephalobus sp. NKZ332]